MNPTSLQKRSHYIELPSFDGSVPAELSADYILPDTYPDVKKLLRVTARPVLIDRYISGKRLEFSGAVDYTVLFSADTEDGESLRCVHFAGEWNSALGDLDDVGSASIDIAPRMVSCTARLSNPRKLSIRSSLTSDVRIMGMTQCDPRVEGAATPQEEQGLERLTENITARRACTFLADPIKISENISPDPSYPQMEEIIACTPCIHITEAKPSLSGGSLDIALKGTLFVDCLYKAAGDNTCHRSFCAKLPLSYNVSADEYAGKFENCLPDSLTARASAMPIDVSAEIGEDSYGERRVLELDLTADVTMRIFGAEDTLLTLDAYSTERESECECTELEATLPAKLYYSNFSVGESVPRENLGLPEAPAVIDARADVKAESLTVDRGRGILTGKADISCIYNDENGGFTSTESTLPLRFEMNLGDISEPISFCTDMTASDLRVRMDSERVYFDFEVSLCLEAAEKRRHSTVSIIRLGDEPRRHPDSGVITVCYPAKTDTAWDVAKRYGISKAALEAANPGAARVLMIPCTTPKSFVV